MAELPVKVKLDAHLPVMVCRSGREGPDRIQLLMSAGCQKCLLYNLVVYARQAQKRILERASPS